MVCCFCMECSKNIKSNSSKVSLKACISLLIFCVDDLSFDESGVSKSPMIIVLLSISAFMFVRFYMLALHVEALLCWVHIYL